MQIYDSRNLVVEETIHVKFNDIKSDKELSQLDEPFISD